MATSGIKKHILFSLLALLAFMPLCHAQNSAQNANSIHFSQQLSWQSDPNAFEYKVEIQPIENSGKADNAANKDAHAQGNAASETVAKPLTITTSESTVKFNLPAGKYRYKIYAYDFLGRLASESKWQNFEIIKALTPSVAVASQKIKSQSPASSSSGGKKGKSKIEAQVTGITENSKVILKNTSTGEEIKGELSVKGSGKNITADSVTFSGEIEKGEWVLQITNPSGLSSVSKPFTLETPEDLKEIQAKQEAAKKEQEEQEKKARQEALAKEQAEKEEAEKEAKKQAKLAKMLEKEKKPEFYFMLGSSTYYNKEESLLFTEYYEKRDSADRLARPFPYAKLSFLPFKTSGWKFGLSAAAQIQQATMSKFKIDGETVSTSLTADYYSLDFVIHRKLIKNRLYLAFNGGFGLISVHRDIDLVLTDNTNRLSESFGFSTVDGGSSLFLTLANGLAIESGTNLIYSKSDDEEFIAINPFVGIGFRF